MGNMRMAAFRGTLWKHLMMGAVISMTEKPNRFVERFGVLMHAIVNVNASDCGIDDAIVAIIPGADAASAEMHRRGSLDPEDDEYLDIDYHIVLPIYVNGVVWNSTDPAPESFWEVEPE